MLLCITYLLIVQLPSFHTVELNDFFENRHSFDPFPALKSPAVAPPHWVPHPALEVVRDLKHDPNAYELLRTMLADSLEAAGRWWEKTGQYQEELNDERVPPLLRGIIPPLPRDAPVVLPPSCIPCFHPPPPSCIPSFHPRLVGWHPASLFPQFWASRKTRPPPRRR